MFLVDANILIYAYDAESPHHDAARRWLERTLSRPEPVGFAWETILAFLRIVTHPRVFERPLTVDEASAAVTSILAEPVVSLALPSERHWEILAQLLLDAKARGPLVMDAHLAALAIEHGATLATTDRDFARFSGLQVVDPLIAR